MHKTGRDISIFAVTFDNGDFDYILLEIRLHTISTDLKVEFETFRYDLARHDTDCAGLAAVGMRTEAGCADFRRLDAVTPHRCNGLACGKQILRNHPAR